MSTKFKLKEKTWTLKFILGENGGSIYIFDKKIAWECNNAQNYT